MPDARARRSLEAAVDESLNRDKTLYVMTAAVYDPARIKFLMRRLEEAAPKNADGQLEVHANELYQDRPELLTSLEEMMAADPAIEFLSTVRAPIQRGREEEARQRCLAHLSVDLMKQFQVGTMYLDTRDGLRRKSQNREHGALQDSRDLATVAALRGVGELPAHFNVRHRDHNTHTLWLADIAAHASQQSISFNNPERIQRLAAKLEMREAVRLPVDQRETAAPTARSNGLSLRLAELRANARQLAATVERAAGYETNNQSQVDAAVDELSAAKNTLNRVAAVEQRAHEQGRRFPDMDEFTNQGTSRER